MCALPCARTGTLWLAAFVLSMALACVTDAQSIRVRVIDRDSRAPIAGAIGRSLC